MWSIFYMNFTKYKWIGLASLIIFLYLAPYLILGEDTHIRVHDNLDSNIVWYKMLAESGHLFSLTDVSLPNVINGLPRSALPSGLDAMVWLYVWFEPMTAYTIGQFIMRFVAFFGMYVLLTKHALRENTSPIITVGSALGFAILPFWPSGMLSIAGVPLALHIFLSIRQYGKKTPAYYWIILILIPLLSSFVLTFIFFLSFMGLLWLVDGLRNKNINWRFFASIVLMTSIYLIKNYLLIYAMFISDGFASHRHEYNLGHNDLRETIDLFFHNLLNGHTHDMAIHHMIILPAIGLAIVIAILRGIKPKLLIMLVITNAAFSLWYAFWYWEGWRPLKDQFTLLNTFNFSRIHFFDPVIWYICFALALCILWKHLKFGHVLACLILIAQCTVLFMLNEEYKYSEIGTPTFAEFYSEELFANIKSDIGLHPAEYRVVSIAMHPTIAQYNGFYTLDTYNNSYPLEYKHDFRRIIAPELAKSPVLETYFDSWGGRLYMYASEVGKKYIFTKSSPKSIEHLNINTKKLKEMGGEYVFSALPIENAEETGLKLEHQYENTKSPWHIYVYRLLD